MVIVSWDGASHGSVSLYNYVRHARMTPNDRCATHTMTRKKQTKEGRRRKGDTCQIVRAHGSCIMGAHKGGEQVGKSNTIFLIDIRAQHDFSLYLQIIESIASNIGAHYISEKAQM